MSRTVRGVRARSENLTSYSLTYNSEHSPIPLTRNKSTRIFEHQYSNQRSNTGTICTELSNRSAVSCWWNDNIGRQTLPLLHFCAFSELQVRPIIMHISKLSPSLRSRCGLSYARSCGREHGNFSVGTSRDRKQRHTLSAFPCLLPEISSIEAIRINSGIRPLNLLRSTNVGTTTTTGENRRKDGPRTETSSCASVS